MLYLQVLWSTRWNSRYSIYLKKHPYKLVPAPDYIPDSVETGTQNHEGIAGIKLAIEFFAQFGQGNSRREKIVSGIHFIEYNTSDEVARFIKALKFL